MGGHRLLSSLCDQPYAGVALLIHARWTDCIVGYKRFSSRVIYADLKIERHMYRFVGTYLPHAGYKFEEFTSCLQDLRTIVMDAQSKSMRIIMGGDFNAEIGRGLRGATLMNFVCELGLNLCNVQEEQDFSSEWTFRSSLGRLRRIDYIVADDVLNVRSCYAIGNLDLGSDHRAVQCCLDFQTPAIARRKQRRPTYKTVDWGSYRCLVEHKLSTIAFSSLADIEKFVVETTSEACLKPANTDASTCESTDHLRELRRLRRQTACPRERRDLSKQIHRLFRKQERVRRAQRITKALQDFTNLGQLARIHRPASRAAKKGPDFAQCAELLRGVYTSDLQSERSLDDSLSGVGIPTFCFDEVKQAVANMAKGKTSDRDGVILEMFSHGGESLLGILTDMLNGILTTGYVPRRWRDSFLTLLHKGGDTSDANNWRPIAILSITYKIFARVVYNRIRCTLDGEQSDEQFGFRGKRSTTDALISAESIVGKAIEFNFDLWLVSVDLKKAFDRVEHNALFDSLRSHGLGEEYCQLLHSIYTDQRGILSDTISFPIGRGVRQGDVLSPLLFNCALEAAIRQWKAELGEEGVAIRDGEQGDRLTNIRFADDLALVRKVVRRGHQHVEQTDRDTA